MIALVATIGGFWTGLAVVVALIIGGVIRLADVLDRQLTGHEDVPLAERTSP